MSNNTIKKYFEDLLKRIEKTPDNVIADLIDSSDLVPSEYDKAMERMIIEGHSSILVNWDEDNGIAYEVCKE